MSAAAVSGKLYSGSITSATGTSGTLINNVEAREYVLRSQQKVSVFNTGLAPDMYEAVFLGMATTLFVVKFRDTGADTINLIFPEMSTSGGIRGDGTGVSNVYDIANKTALIVRPNTSTQKTLYIANAQIAPDNVIALLYSERRLHLADNEIAFIASKAADGTEPSFAYDSATNVNGLYAGLS